MENGSNSIVSCRAQVSLPQLPVESADKIRPPIRQPGDVHTPTASESAIGYTRDTMTGRGDGFKTGQIRKGVMSGRKGMGSSDRG